MTKLPADLRIASDGLPARIVRPWAKDKAHYLRGYVDIFTTSMKNQFDRRVYIDLFSGPGRSIVEDNLEELDGSPLIAVNARSPFTELHFNDVSPTVTEALKARLGDRANVHISNLDCNAAALKAREILFSPEHGRSSVLGLAFIDPTAFQIGFGALSKLTAGRRIDVLMTVMTGYMKRFIDRPSYEQPLDRYFGSPHWRDLVDQKAAGEAITSRALLDHYENRLRELEYVCFVDDIRIVNSRESTIYHMVFASKHERGCEFFRKSSKKSSAGQMKLDI